jgi:hypothetical protein
MYYVDEMIKIRRIVWVLNAFASNDTDAIYTLPAHSKS